MSDASYVLDASALLALMLAEPGADFIGKRLGDACIGAVNLSEVVAKLQERDVPVDVIDESLADLDLPIIAFDAAQADRAGKLRTATRARGLSLGDRACLALADISGAIALTTDTAWIGLELGVRIELARG
jgi:PIN domain nuclease of toxin-antitoxin system